jgi:hypothetical protein
MYDYMLEEMAEAVAQEFHLDHNAVLSLLARYWQDKIAHVWQVEDVLDCARRLGKPITPADALSLLQQIFDQLDSDIGINWPCLEVALHEYRLDFAALSSEEYGQVHGIFKVWQEGEPIAHQFGMEAQQVDGNLPEALACARALAVKTPGRRVFLDCEPRLYQPATPWLTIFLKDGETEPVITESEAVCTPFSPDSTSAS